LYGFQNRRIPREARELYAFNSIVWIQKEEVL